MSIRVRLAVWFAAVVAVGVAATSTTSYLSTQAELNAGVEEFLVSRAAELVEGSRSLPRERGRHVNEDDVLEATVEALPFDQDSIVQALDDAGDIAATAGPELPVSDLDRALAGATGSPAMQTVAIGEEEFRLITASIPGGGAVQVARSLTETADVLAGLRNRSILIGGAVSVMAALVGWAVTSRGTRALRNLTATAEHVADTQDLSAKINPRRADEVGRLSSSLDKMLGALRQSQNQQHQLLEDAAHELRTPLTTLQANAQLLERVPAVDDPLVEELVGSIRSELGELSNLFEELIELATGAHEIPPFEVVDLNDPAESALRIFAVRSDRDVKASLDGSQVYGNAELLERAVANLLLNADKFTPGMLPITLAVSGPSIAISDHGPGIPGDERDRVFDRFFRSETTRSLPGSGLGLAIVKKIVDQHRGRVFVSDTPGGGATVGFRLPATSQTFPTAGNPATA